MAKKENNTNLTELLLSEADPMLAMLEWLCEQLMEAEISAKVGAGRKGGYIPFFVSDRKRSEAALVQVIQEAVVNGVSGRKMERLAKSLGIENLSRSQVSNMAKELDEQVEAFRNRSLDEQGYPVLWVDALYEKVRYDGRVVNMAMAWRIPSSSSLSLRWTPEKSLRPTCWKGSTRRFADAPGWLAFSPTLQPICAWSPLISWSMQRIGLSPGLTSVHIPFRKP